MSAPSLNLNQQGIGTPIHVVSDPGPGVETVQWSSEGGMSAFLVAEGGDGVRSVYFQGGPPPEVVRMMGMLPPAGDGPNPTEQLLLLS